MRLFSLIIAFGFLVANNAIAQDGGNFKIEPPKPIIESEIKEVKLWGLYEEIPDLPLLPTELWLNSNFSNLKFAFSKVAASNEFKPIEKLSQRVIFSGGIAPNDDEKLAKARFYSAHSIGPNQFANNLLANFPQIYEEENLAIIYAENLFYENKIELACEIISSLKPKLPKRKLLELRATCFALHNEADAARLSLEVASSLEPKQKDDFLLHAIQYVANIKDGILPIGARNFEFNGQNGMNFILSKTAKADSSKAEILSANALQILVSENSKLPNNYIIDALRYGLFDYSALQKYLPYIAQEAIPNNEDVKKIDNAMFEKNIADEIYFYLKKARNIKEFANIAKTIAPKLAEVKNFNIENVGFFAAAALLNNQKDLAQHFLNMDFANKAGLELGFALIADFPKDFAITRRIESEKPKSLEQANAYADAIIAAEIIEKSTNINNFLDLNLPKSNSYNAQILYSIEKAASKNAIAETILLSSLILQSEKVKNIDVFALARIIRALNLVKLESEAKELALFSIIGRNLDFSEEIKPNNNSSPKTILLPLPKTENKQSDLKLEQAKVKKGQLPDWKPNVD